MTCHAKDSFSREIESIKNGWKFPYQYHMWKLHTATCEVLPLETVYIEHCWIPTFYAGPQNLKAGGSGPGGGWAHLMHRWPTVSVSEIC